MKEIYSQFLQTLVNFGVPLKDASRSNEYVLQNRIQFLMANPLCATNAKSNGAERQSLSS